MNDDIALKYREYHLRWRFDYIDRVAPKYGHWDRSSQNPEEMACFQNREGVIRASIEGKDVRTKELVVLAECDGHDFVNFQWMAVAFVPTKFKGSFTPRGYNIGMKLVTRDFEYQVFMNGEILKVPRTEEDKGFHYATFGR